MEYTQTETNLSEDNETSGFDVQAGQSWIYPTNYPLRDYQYNIVQKALLQNTLVSLPTGLGKTFIAAVVMYNFFRWFPRGKIIFMAPTKPLVKQQIDACYNIMAIPREVTTELTGSKTSSVRSEIWLEKRVFFATPQVLQNDLDKIMELGPKIKCLVFDEAHKARGSHAYCEVIKRLKEQKHQYFRVLALSATPGSTVHDVLEVVQNLLISHLEFRTEESIDVRPYVFTRSLETVVVPLGDKLQEVKYEYIKTLEYFTRTLMKYKVVHGNCSTLTKGKIFMTMKEFQQKQRGNSSSNYSEIMKSLNISITLYHAYELLERHGLRSFLSFFDEHIDKPLLRGNRQIIQIMEDVRNYLGPAPNVDLLPDGTIPEIPKSIKFGHPKYYKLQEVLISHFKQASNESRVIVFFEYRESVMEAYALLLQARPLLKPKIFLGQGSGITQKVQVKVVRDFREGLSNVLLSTSIGEEGLDVGEVDLIVCFDISTKSPIRMVQRMGRTGRKREGQIIILVTEGREQQTLKDCLIHKNNVTHYVLNSNELLRGMYPSSPRMVPENIQPKCEKIYITVKPVLTKKSTLKDIFRSMSSTSEPFSPDLDIIETVDRLPKIEMFCNKSNPLEQHLNYPRFSYSIDKQRQLQPTCIVRHSTSSEVLVDLLQIADSRRFNIPMSQMKSGANKSKNLKQSDIRNMFIKTSSQNDFQLTQQNEDNVHLPSFTPLSQPEHVEALEIVRKLPKELFTEISTYLSINAVIGNNCKGCPQGVDCDKLCHSLKCNHMQHNNWIPLDDNVFESITLHSLKEFRKSMGFEENSQGVNSSVNDIELQDSFANIEFTQLEKQANDSKNKTVVAEKSFSYKPPNNFMTILTKCSDLETNCTKVANKDNCISANDILEQLLCFFKLNTIDEIFCQTDTPDTIICTPGVINESPVLELKDFNLSQAMNVVSPNTPKVTKGSPEKSNEILCSPILSNTEKIKNYKRKILFEKSSSLESHVLHNSTPVTNIMSQILNSSNEIKSSYCKTDLKMKCSSHYNHTVKKIEENSENGIANNFDISDICDMSFFEKQEQQTDTENKNAKLEKEIHLDDICDLSVFGINASDNELKSNTSRLSSSQECAGDVTNNKKSTIKQPVELERKKENNFDLSVLKDIDDLCDLSDFGIHSQKENENVQINQNVLMNEFCKNEFKMSGTQNLAKTNIQNEESSGVLNKSISQMCITQMIDYIGKCDTQINENQKLQSREEQYKNSTQNICNKVENKIVMKDNSVVDLTTNSPFKSKTESKGTINLSANLNDRTTSNYLDQHSKLVDELANYDEFNFSFNTPTSKKHKLHTNKNCNDDFKLFTRKENKSRQEDDPYKIITQNSQNRGLLEAPITSALNKSETTSDDEFENKPKSPVWIKPKSRITPIKKNGALLHDTPSVSKNKPSKKSTKSKLTRNPFIEEEAELSENDRVFVSDDEEGHMDEDLDRYDESFVHDETHFVGTQMHAKYLQSIRSPSLRGKFKIPAAPRFVTSNIYSQPVCDEENSYLDDSFCVRDEEEEPQNHELSELEILELQLKKRKKRKKSTEEPTTKRRRILVLSDDSD